MAVAPAKITNSNVAIEMMTTLARIRMLNPPLEPGGVVGVHASAARATREYLSQAACRVRREHNQSVRNARGCHRGISMPGWSALRFVPESSVCRRPAAIRRTTARAFRRSNARVSGASVRGRKLSGRDRAVGGGQIQRRLLPGFDDDLLVPQLQVLIDGDGTQPILAGARVGKTVRLAEPEAPAQLDVAVLGILTRQGDAQRDEPLPRGDAGPARHASHVALRRGLLAGRRGVRRGRRAGRAQPAVDLTGLDEPRASHHELGSPRLAVVHDPPELLDRLLAAIEMRQRDAEREPQLEVARFPVERGLVLGRRAGPVM